MRTELFRRGIGVAIVCICLGMSTAGFGQGATNAPADEKKAAEILQEVKDFYRSLKTLAAETTLTIKDSSDPAQVRQSETAFSISVRQPDRVRADVRGDAINLMAVSDGKKLYVLEKKENSYSEHAAPANAATVLAAMASNITTRLGTMLMSEPFRSAPFDGLDDPSAQRQYLGEEERDGKRYRHITSVQKDLDWEMWVETGEKPLIEKLTLDARKMFANMKDKPQEKPLVFSVEIVYKKWTLDAEMPDATFAFAAPEGAKRIEPEKPSEGGNALQGKEAPAFTLDLLDGGKVNLADHKGKQVVVLDFWASWCGPCRQVMPVYAKVAADYKDKGVVFYAVNIGETADKIRSFLESTHIQCTVALDSESEVATQYGASSIPMSFIIDKKGVIAKVHLGATSNLDAEVRRELDTLLSEAPESQ